MVPFSCSEPQTADDPEVLALQRVLLDWPLSST